MCLSMKEGASSARQGQAWDWKSPAHRALGPRLLEVLQRVHDLGIRHGDLHPGNILVTPDSVVFILDFDGCEIAAPERALAAEQHDLEYMLSLKPHVSAVPIQQLTVSAA